MSLLFPWRVPWRKKPIEEPSELAFELDAIGFIRGMTDGEVTYLTDLYVMPAQRVKGHGRELIERFIDAAKDTTIVVLTRDAAEFYKKFGFEERTALIRRPK